MMGAILRAREMYVKATNGGGRALGTFSPEDLDQQRALGTSVSKTVWASKRCPECVIGRPYAIQIFRRDEGLRR